MLRNLFARTQHRASRLFSIKSGASFQSLFFEQAAHDHHLWARFQKTPLLPAWRPLRFSFQALGKRDVQRPDLCTIYARGILAFHAKEQDRLFPPANAVGLEFLPILAGDEPWFLLNCLNSVSAYDQLASRAVRALNGDVAWMSRLVVAGTEVHDLELFTLPLTHNRQLFVREAFRARVKALQLKGVDFQPAGRVDAAIALSTGGHRPTSMSAPADRAAEAALID